MENESFRLLSPRLVPKVCAEVWRLAGSYLGRPYVESGSTHFPKDSALFEELENGLRFSGFQQVLSKRHVRPEGVELRRPGDLARATQEHDGVGEPALANGDAAQHEVP